MFRLRATLLYALIPGTLVITWITIAGLDIVKPVFLPRPSEVVRTAVELAEEGSLSRHSIASISRIFWGFLLTIALAFPIGAAMGLSQSGRKLFQPLNSLLRYMPFPAFVPLLILWFGIGTQTQISVIFVGTFFQLTVLIQDAFSDIHEEYLETARSLSFSRTRMFLLVRLPAAANQCYDAIRVGIGWAWTCLIVAEMVGADDGLGHMIIVGQRFLKTPQVFVGIFVIGLLGLLMDSLLRMLRPVLIPWTSQTR